MDSVHIGQSARLRLSVLNTRLTPEVAAAVTNVSADRLVDESTREPYYRARLVRPVLDSFQRAFVEE
ncbi:HlyD family secretion protein [Mesorhizobium sanjuanii]|uniref:HlyD family secretion protein n=1 Tax=Mesorhizobium sanjuanii TaxID=2037900 RepID=UPI0024780F8C|nr:HlyD family secretion protein [Mesorhizobium sanjuanii]